MLRKICNSPLRLLLAAVMLISLMPSNAFPDLPETEGAGFIPEVGEYLSDSMWTKEDTINLVTNAATDGGEVAFLTAGVKYSLSVFIGYAGKPLEFWINYVQHWRYDMELDAPEDFVAITAMFLDKRVDLGLVQLKCADLQKSEGWDNDDRFKSPYAMIDGNVRGAEIAGGFAAIGGAVLRQASNPHWRPPVVTPEEFRAKFGEMDSKLFEDFVNKAGEAGYLKSLGIPGGENIVYLSLRYGKHNGGGVLGPDGFFINKATGESYLLEAKYAMDGRGKLGKPFKDVVQGSPEWLQKALYQIKEQDAKWGEHRFADLMTEAGDTRFKKVLQGVEKVYEHVQSHPGLDKDAIEVLKNFADPAEIKKILQASMPEDIEDYAKFWYKDYHFSVLNKEGLRPTYFDGVVKESVAYSATFGREMEEVTQKMVYAAIK